MRINKIVSLAILLSLGVFSFAAISAQGLTSKPLPPQTDTATKIDTSKSTLPFCGNNRCDIGETHLSCAVDCPATPITCPANGAVFAPRNSDFLGVGMKEITQNLGPGGYGTGTPIYSAVAQRLNTAGVQWTVKQVPQQFVEPSQGQFSWANHDALFGAWRSNNINIIGTLHGGAAWATDPANPQYPRQDVWATYVRQVVLRYGPAGLGEVHDWETWNEPNMQQGTFAAFQATHQTAYAAIKSADPQARVWGPGVFFTHDNKASMYVFLREFIAGASFDGLSIHTYIDTPEENYEIAAAVRGMLDSAKRGNVPIAVTEFNIAGSKCDASAAGQVRQATFLRETYACFASAGVNYALWFTSTDWHTTGGGCADAINHVGVLTSAGEPKLSYYALKELGDSITPSPPAPIPTATLSASPNPTDSGSHTTLAWSSNHTTSCSVTSGSASGFAITNGAVSGSDVSGNLTTATTFAISCSGIGGTATASVTVNVNDGSGGGGGGGTGGSGGGSSGGSGGSSGGSSGGATGNTASLQAQIAALMAQIAALQAQLGITPTTTGGGAFIRSLTMGSQGEDVRALQVYLNTHGAIVAASGPGSRGSETSTFGPATRAALIRFQVAKGISPAAGFFGLLTRAYVSAHP
jgi:hypothetical protein